MPLRLVAFALFLAANSVASAFAQSTQNSVTIDDLIGRARIVLAAISPDGRYAAWLTARGNALDDAYDMTLEVMDTKTGGAPLALAAYRLDGSSALQGERRLRLEAGALYWTARNTLLFTERSGDKMRLAAWSPRDGKTRVLLDGHDKILLEDGDRVVSEKALLAIDAIPAPRLSSNGAPADRAWRMTDDDRFYGERPNPKIRSYVREQTYGLSFDKRGNISVTPEGDGEDRWDGARPWPISAPPHALKEAGETEDARVFHYSIVPSPNARYSAFVRSVSPKKLSADRVSKNSSVVVSENGEERILVSPTEYSRRIFGWASDAGPVYFLETRGEETMLAAVTLEGVVTSVLQEDAALEAPCHYRQCQIISADGRHALLIRSTNLSPDALLKIDFKQNTVETLAAPNDGFRLKNLPAIRHYDIDIPAGKAWGRLYLPTDHPAGAPYPLIVTQYGAGPGFVTVTGDEVPILPLTTQGIAVLAMLPRFNEASGAGDFAPELARLERPLKTMEWIIGKLTDEGIIDPKRVGLTGLSYGAEIAMYAYWKSDLFAALSTSSTSWDPSLLAFGGVNYVKSNLLRRGYTPVGDAAGMQNWRKLSAGLNARADLPPLLIQGAEGEQNYTAPTWTALRLADAPVEWYDYPEAESGHIKMRPANKWWVYARNLDWFRFWLQGEEDPAPEKAEQYSRWREMRSTQCELFKGDDELWYCRPSRNGNLTPLPTANPAASRRSQPEPGPHLPAPRS